MSDTSQGEPGSAQHILHLVSSGAATSRADLVRELGLAPSTVSLRVQELVAAGVLTESGEGASRGGRRPALLRVRAQGGVALAADLGSHHARLGVVGLDGTVLDAVDLPHDITVGPEPPSTGSAVRSPNSPHGSGRRAAPCALSASGSPARSSPARAAS